jgi:hypothetical protein
LSHHGGKRKKLVMPGHGRLLLRRLGKLVSDAGLPRFISASREGRGGELTSWNSQNL